MTPSALEGEGPEVMATLLDIFLPSTSEARPPLDDDGMWPVEAGS